MKGALVVTGLILASVGLYYLFLTPPDLPENDVNALVDGSNLNVDATAPTPPEDYTPVNTPLFLNSTPVNNAVATEVPSRVIVRFRDQINPMSTVTVSRNGTLLATAPAIPTSDSLTLALDLPDQKTAGVYRVTYKECSAPGECEQGHFTFTVRRAK